MTTRYEHPSLAKLWSDESEIARWAEIEIYTSVAQAQNLDFFPMEAAEAIEKAAPAIEADDVKHREKTTHHDVGAFVQLLGEQMELNRDGDYAKWAHYGLTSSDIVDTSLAWKLKTSSSLVSAEVYAVTAAFAHRRTLATGPRMGRTHGQIAEPVPWSLYLSRLEAAFTLNVTQLQASVPPIKLSGAVGTYSGNPRAVERYVADAIGLPVEHFPSQVMQRWRISQWAFYLVQLAGACEQVATEVRLYSYNQPNPIMSEPFVRGQIGSSVMPHKRNPIRSERLCGLARVARGYLVPLLETGTALWNERDISNSSVERTALRDLVVLVGWMLHETADLVRNLGLDHYREDGMIGTLPTSSALMQIAIKHGAERRAAYEDIQTWGTVTLDSFPDEAHRDAFREEAKEATDVGWYFRNL